MDKNINFKKYPSSEYFSESDFDKIVFPEEIQIAYAVCGKQCGNHEFIVDGQSQICERCAHNMFRTITATYVKKGEHVI